MRKYLPLIVALGLSTMGLSAQGKPTIVVQAFTVAAGVELPYDMKLMQMQLVPEFRVMLSKQFDIVAESPAAPQGAVYTLDAEITG